MIVAGNDIRLLISSVDEELKSALLRYRDMLPLSLITMGKFALGAPGKVMSTPLDEEFDAYSMDRLPRWPLWVLLSGQAANPGDPEGWRQALPAAVAVEIAMAAADLIDEITDDDPSPFVEKYGAGQALNTGNLMLVMAQQVLLWSAQESGGERALRALGALQDMLAQAAVGQHFDMLYERMEAGEVTTEMSLQMTELKAGALVSGACRMGAIMAGASGEVEELLGRFGRQIGCIAQLANDVQDVTPRRESDGEGAWATEPERKTDLRRRKRTLPIVFALHDDSAEPNPVQKAFAAEGGTPVDEEDLRRAVEVAGGLQFAHLVTEVHSRNAAEAVAELEKICPGAKTVLAPLAPRWLEDEA